MKNLTKEYLMFVLNEEIYGVPMTKVKGIFRMKEYVKSLANQKGKELPILDLRKKLDYVGKDYDENTSIISVEVESYGVFGNCGILVDAVQEVWDIESEEICEPLPYGTYLERELLSGMGIVNDEVVTLLNVDNIMPIEDLEKLQDLRANDKPQEETESISVFDQQWLSITENLWTKNTTFMF